MGKSGPRSDQQTAKEIFSDACDVPPEGRAAWLDARCAGDGPLRAQVDVLLCAHDRAGAFLADPGRARSAAVPAAVDPCPNAVTDPAPPGRVGPYRLVELIGEGGFGTVFEAQQEHPLRRRVALKLIKPGMDTLQVIARFEAEREALAVMDHPNIARILDAGATETGRPFFVMELVRGVPITEHCDQHRLSIRHRLELFVSVCLAVQHAHEKGVIHRDLKPTNVLVTWVDPGAPAVAKVIDFGIAKAIRGRALGTALATEFHQLLGSPQYMSPEQTELDAPNVDTRSDVYSLGVLLYELLTGTTPLDGEKLRSAGYEQFRQLVHRHDPPAPSVRLSELAGARTAVATRRRTDPPRLARALRGELDWVVMKCLEKDRSRRYESAGALAADLRRYLASEPVLARPASVLYRLDKFMRTHKMAALSAALIVLAVALGMIGTTAGMLRARAAKRHAESTERLAIDQRNSALDSQKRAEISAQIARREAERAAAVSQYMRGAFALSRTEFGPGEGDAAVELFKTVAAEIDTKLKDQPGEELVARMAFAEACRWLELHGEAVHQLERAYVLSRGQPGGMDSEQTLAVAADLAAATYLVRDYARALAVARPTYLVALRVLGDRNPITWKATNAYALALNGSGEVDRSYLLLKDLVNHLRDMPEARTADRLGRYSANLAVCFRDRGQEDDARAAMQEVVRVFREDANLKENPDMLRSYGWVSRLLLETPGCEEAQALLRDQIASILRVHPQGTETASDRLADLALMRLRDGDEAEAAALFARSMAMCEPVRGQFGSSAHQTWRTWTLCCDRSLSDEWRSRTLRSHVWCALDDLLRDNQPARLMPEEVALDRLHFNLIRWPTGADAVGGAAGGTSIAEGGMEQLKAVAEPEPGLYLLGLQVPRPAAAPLVRAKWLLVAPWELTFGPVPRLDVSRTYSGPLGGAWNAAPLESVRHQITSALALHDGLDLVSGAARRLHWFRVVADAKVDLPAGRYRISMTVDDGARLWVDDRLVFGDSDPSASRTEDAEVDLAGRSHHLRVEFFQEVGGYRLWLQVAPRSGPARAQAAALGGGVPAFDFLVGELALETARNPADPRLATARGEALGLSGRFLESAAEYARATQLDPAEHLNWYSRACLLGYTGESDKYHEVCQAMVLRFGSSSDGATCQHVANSCMLLPDSGVDPKEVTTLLDRALAGKVPPHLLPSLELSRGMAGYRAGRFDSALVWLDKARADLPDELASSMAMADFLTAMSQERLGRSAEAHAAFQRASARVESRVPTAGVDNLKPEGLENWLMCQCTRREAQHLLALQLP